MLRIREVIGVAAGHRMVPGNHQFAVGQFFFHQKSWQHRHTAADLGGANAHIEGFEAWPVVAVFGLVALTGEPVVPCLRSRSILQQNQIGELRRIGEWLFRQAARCTDRHQLFAEQFQAFRSRPRTLAEIERQIAAPLQQIVRFLLVAQIQMNRRMAQAPALEARHQPPCAEGRWSRNAQDFRLAAVGTQVMRRHFHLGENFSYLDQIQIPGRGHLQAAAHAPKQ